jgi:hypothetical protein
VRKFRPGGIEQPASTSEGRAARSNDAEETPAPKSGASWVKAYTARSSDEERRSESEPTVPAGGSDLAQQPDEFEPLRQSLEATLAAAREAAAKIKARAQAEAEEILKTAARKAAARLEEERRGAEELRARAEREVEEAGKEGARIRRRAEQAYASGLHELDEKAKQQEKALTQRLELLGSSMLELVEGFRALASDPGKLVSASGASKDEEEGGRDESAA